MSKWVNPPGGHVMPAAVCATVYIHFYHMHVTTFVRHSSLESAHTNSVVQCFGELLQTRTDAAGISYGVESCISHGDQCSKGVSV